MVPSTTRLRASSSAAAAADGAARQEQSPGCARPHPEEPLLHFIPAGIHPTYRSLPLPLQFVIVLLSAWTSAVTTWKQRVTLTWLQPLAMMLRGWRPAAPTVKEFVGFAAKVRSRPPAHDVVLGDTHFE
jgi:hypothetical protein